MAEEKTLTAREIPGMADLLMMSDELRHIVKGSTHAQGWAYRGIDAVMKELNPLFNKYGIMPCGEVISHNVEHYTDKDKNGKDRMNFHAVIVVRYKFTSKWGVMASSDGCGEGLAFACDTATDKAMSYAFKQAMCFAFCIPTTPPEQPADVNDGLESGIFADEDPALAQAANYILKIKSLVTLDKSREKMGSNPNFNEKQKARLFLFMDERKLALTPEVDGE